MKLFRYILLVSVSSLAIILFSCSDILDALYVPSSDYLKVSDVVTDGNESSVTIHIESDCAWNISEEVEWLTVSPIQGNGDADVTLNTGVNPSSIQERSCKITVTTHDGVNKVVNFKQGRSKESLSVSTKSLSFGETGGINRFTVTSNTAWTITGGAEWFDYDPVSGTDNGTVSLMVQTNNTEFSREAVLTVTGSSGKKEEISVIQTEKTVTLTIEPEVINATAVANDYLFRIMGNATWSITVDDNSWLTLSETKGSNGADIFVDVNDNITTSQRVANIHITSESGKIKQNCVLTQAAATVPVMEKVNVSGVGRYVASFKSSFKSPLEVTNWGFVWSTSSNPIYDESTDKLESTDSGLIFMATDSIGKENKLSAGILEASLNTLRSGVTYYVRAFAVNECGIGYSEDAKFTTGGNLPGDDDNHVPNL